MTSPVAYPVALSSAPEFHLQNADVHPISGDDSCAPSCHPRRVRRRAGRVLTVQQRERLSERDVTVLASVGKYRYMTAVQIEELHFSGHTTRITGARTCRRVLSRLTDCGLLRRLDRRVGGVRAGSASFVYGLAPLGQRTVAPDSGSRIRYHEPSDEFLEHTLAIAQLAVNLYVLARSGSADIVAIEPEPGCWRRFTGGLDGPQTLKPDLYVSLRSGDFDYQWFVEVDRATHSAAAVVRKCKLYHRYWQTGAEQERSGLFPRVLFIVPSKHRAGLIEHAIRRAHGLNRNLFAVTTNDDALQWLTGAKS